MIPKQQYPQFRCKCIACGQRFTLTDTQVREATEVGCAISPCCGFPATVQRVEVNERLKERGK